MILKTLKINCTLATSHYHSTHTPAPIIHFHSSGAGSHVTSVHICCKHGRFVETTVHFVKHISLIRGARVRLSATHTDTKPRARSLTSLRLRIRPHCAIRPELLFYLGPSQRFFFFFFLSWKVLRGYLLKNPRLGVSQSPD